MAPRTFEWDDAKAAKNVAKHGVRFEVAILVFKDPDRVDIVDRRKDYGEVRHIVLAKVQGVVLFVAYTMRGSVGRIISARVADPEEGDAYHGKFHARQRQRARFQRSGAKGAKGAEP